MKISKERPPVYDQAKKLWPAIDFERGTVFTYGDTVHVFAGELSPDLAAHEAVHIKQQGDTPDIWWDMYFKSPQFRLSQELEAYRVQYQWILRNERNKRKHYMYLNHYAQTLSGGIYGNLVNYFQALTLISNPQDPIPRLQL